MGIIALTYREAQQLKLWKLAQKLIHLVQTQLLQDSFLGNTHASRSMEIDRCEGMSRRERCENWHQVSSNSERLPCTFTVGLYDQVLQETKVA